MSDSASSSIYSVQSNFSRKYIDRAPTYDDEVAAQVFSMFTGTEIPPEHVNWYKANFWERAEYAETQDVAELTETGLFTCTGVHRNVWSVTRGQFAHALAQLSPGKEGDASEIKESEERLSEHLKKLEAMWAATDRILGTVQSLQQLSGASMCTLKAEAGAFLERRKKRWGVRKESKATAASERIKDALEAVDVAFKRRVGSIQSRRLQKHQESSSREGGYQVADSQRQSGQSAWNDSSTASVSTQPATEEPVVAGEE